MSIFVRPLFDPTAQQIVPQGPDTYVMPARSRALQRLADDMYLYAIRAVQGRSFLIAGHRGSGKTSLVNNALEEVRQRLATSNQYNRLIDIRLHGPDLLSRSSPEATKPVAAEDTRKMLTQVTLAFYQKVADIYAAAYRKRVMTITKGRSEEAVELAAQMRLDLDSAPGLPLLRDYWERAHALETGVLSFDTNETQYTYRGIDELVALACAAQAYQRVVGELTVKDETSDTAKREQKAEYEAKTDLKEMLSPLFGIAAGGAAGAAAFATSGSALAAAGLGVLTAGLSASVLRYSSSRSRQSARSREITFLPDTKVESLDRMLPLLVERFRRCDVTPIFVVDELDKVPNLSQRMEDLVSHLKHFVTEKAFFCFLANRDYYEEVMKISINEPYPKEHTYFSDRLLVYFSPDDLHNYLSRALSILNNEDQQAAEVLRYILLHRARSHPFDLRQQLGDFQDETNEIKLTTSQILDAPAYRFDVTLQVAVEIMMRDKVIVDRLHSNPEFTQLACDALYYPSRCLAEGKPNVDLSEEGFRTYLCTRLGVKSISGSEPAILLAAVGALLEMLCDVSVLRSHAVSSNAFPGSVIETLYSEPLITRENNNYYRWNFDAYGRKLPKMLSGPVSAVVGSEAPLPVAAPLSVQASSPAPQRKQPIPPSQPPREEVEPRQTPEEVLNLVSEYEESIRHIEEHARFVRKISDDFLNLKLLAVEYRLINITPTWEGVQASIDRLHRAKEMGYYSQLDQDTKLVKEYQQLISSRWRGILNALYLGVFLGALGDAQDTWAAWKGGLQLLSTMLRFESSTGDEIDRRLSAILVEAQAQAVRVRSFSDRNVGELEYDAYRRMLDAVRSDTPTHRSLFVDEASASFWTKWRIRFGDALSGMTYFTPSWFDLVCAQTGFGPAKQLNLDLAQVTIRSWTGLLQEAMNGSIPTWTAAPILAFLGFKHRMSIFYSLMPPDPDAAREFRAWESSTATQGISALVIVAGDTGLGRPTQPLPSYPCLMFDRKEIGNISSIPSIIALAHSVLEINDTIIEIPDSEPENDIELIAKGGNLFWMQSLNDFNKVFACSSALAEKISDRGKSFISLSSSPQVDTIVDAKSLLDALKLLQKLRSR